MTNLNKFNITEAQMLALANKHDMAYTFGKGSMVRILAYSQELLDLADPSIASSAPADERAVFEKAMNDARFFPAELDFTMTKSPSGKRDEYVNTHLESCWNGWQARAAIAASQQAASQPPLTQTQIDYIGEQWDGCMYDAPGMMIDIGESIRHELARLNQARAILDKFGTNKP